MWNLKHSAFPKYYRGYQIKEYEMGRACSIHWRNALNILVAKAERKTPLGTLGIKMWTAFTPVMTGSVGELLLTHQ
jgi:hypothetical protein